MRRLMYVALVCAIVVGSAFVFVANRGVQASDTPDIPVKAVGVNSSVQEGKACAIARTSGLYPGFPQQVLFRDASDTIVAKHTLIDGKGNSDQKCEVTFSIPFPDSPFVTVFVDDSRITTLEPSDLPFPDNAPLNLWVPD